MLEQRQPAGVEKYVGKNVVSLEGEKLGTVERFIPDRLTEVATWIFIESGLLKTRRYMVPLAGSDFEDDQIRLAYSSQVVTEEPEIESDEMTPEIEAMLETYFGLGAASH